MPLSLGITLSPRVIPILQISFDGKGKERKGRHESLGRVQDSRISRRWMKWSGIVIRYRCGQSARRLKTKRETYKLTTACYLPIVLFEMETSSRFLSYFAPRVIAGSFSSAVFIVEIYRKNELPPCSGSGKERKKERGKNMGRKKQFLLIWKRIWA